MTDQTIPDLALLMRQQKQMLDEFADFRNQLTALTAICMRVEGSAREESLLISSSPDSDKARNLGRTFKAMAAHLRLHGDLGGASLCDRRSAWWLAYADRAEGRSDTDTAP